MSIVPEIQEIHDTMKGVTGKDFFIVYCSRLSQVSTKIRDKLSRGYYELFEKTYNDYPMLAPHDPFEHPLISIERQQQRIERAWNSVQSEMSSIRSSLEGYKKLFLPIIENDLKGDHTETMKCIKNIPYDTKYSPNTGFFAGPYTELLVNTNTKAKIKGIRGISNAIIFPKYQFDKVLSSIIVDKMLTYGEKDLLQEFIPLIRKVKDITTRTRKLEEEIWKKDNLQKGEYNHWRIDMHNSVGFINSGLGLNIYNSLKRIKLLYPDI